MLADETEQTIDEITSIEEAAARHTAAGGAKFNALPVIRALMVDQDSAGEDLGVTFARDQGEFFDLILELADIAATCISIRDTQCGTSAAETLAGLEEMMKDFGRGQTGPCHRHDGPDVLRQVREMWDCGGGPAPPLSPVAAGPAFGISGPG